MKYITEFSNEKNYIRAYDEKKNGLRQVGDMFFLYHNSIISHGVFDTEVEAVKRMFPAGCYSTRQIIMPDGTETTPARYFGTEDINDVFVSWYDVKGELWPGETA